MRRSTLGRSIVVLVTLAAALGLVAPASAAPRKDKYTYLIGSTPQFAPIVVGVNKGFCKPLGLHVEFKQFTSGGVAAQSYIGGQGDFVNAGDWPAIRMWLQTKNSKDPVVGIHPSAHYTDLSVVVARTEIKTPQDFKGKTMGVWLGTTSEFFAAKYLDANRVPLDSVKFRNVQPAEMVPALDRGDIDGFTIWQPFGWRALEVSGPQKVHILTTGKGFFTEYMVSSVRKSMLEQDPDAVKAMVECTRRGGEYATRHPDEAADIVGKQFKIPPEHARRMIEVMRMEVGYTPTFRKDMSDLNKFMLEKDKSAGQLDWNTMFDPRGLRSVDPALLE
jgi:NitT/TauT family transport system substrate-binding protein